MTLMHRFFAVLFFVIALIGIAIPGLPTVPFVLLAAWFAGKGWPKFETWLLAHPYFGPHIHNWRKYRAIPRRAKWASSIFMSISAILIVYSSALTSIKILVCLILVCVGIWIWSRSEVQIKKTRKAHCPNTDGQNKALNRNFHLNTTTQDTHI